jgi:hypothetical protein
MSSMLQRSYARDQARYPMAVGCLMWWGLFAGALAGFLTFFFVMSWYKAELGPSQICGDNASIGCVALNTIVPIVGFAVLFVTQLYMIYLVEARKSAHSLGRTYAMLVISMVLLPVFGTVIGLYLLLRLARDPAAQRYYAVESGE